MQNNKTFLCVLLSILLLTIPSAWAVPHIFNGDCPVVLVQETEFHTAPFFNNESECGTTLVVGKAVGGIKSEIAPGSVVLLLIQGKEEEPGVHRNGRRLFVAQLAPGLVRSLHPGGSSYYVDGYDFTCFCASWLLKMNPSELKPEWRQLQQQVYSLLHPAIPSARELRELPAPGSPELQLFAACSQKTTNSISFSAAPRKLSHAVHALITAGADVNARCNAQGMTPLMQAALHNDSTACSLLLCAGADPNLRDVNGMTALNYALVGLKETTMQPDALRALLPWGTRIDLCCTPPQGAAYAGASPLHHAVLLNSRFAVEELVDRGADVSARDAAGRTALDLARELQYPGIVSLLEKRGKN